MEWGPAQFCPLVFAVAGWWRARRYSEFMPLQYPSLEDLLQTARVVVLPMRVKFRGILERETLLLRGPLGWGEFGAFPEYGDAEASRWLAAAIEAGWHGFPDPLRTSIPVNATVPAVEAGRVPEILARFGRVDAVKVKVAELGQRSTTTPPALPLSAPRFRTQPSAWTPTAAGTFRRRWRR
jgi:hypothetical protein